MSSSAGIQGPRWKTTWLFRASGKTHLLSHTCGHRVASLACKPALRKAAGKPKCYHAWANPFLYHLLSRENFSSISMGRPQENTQALTFSTHRVKFLLPSRYVLPGEIKKSRHHNVKTCVHFIPLGKLHIKQIIPEQWLHISSPTSHSMVSSQGTPVWPVFYHWLGTMPPCSLV